MFFVYFQPIVLKRNNEPVRYDELEPTPNCSQPLETIKGWLLWLNITMRDTFTVACLLYREDLHIHTCNYDGLLIDQMWGLYGKVFRWKFSLNFFSTVVYIDIDPYMLIYSYTIDFLFSYPSINWYILRSIEILRTYHHSFFSRRLVLWGTLYSYYSRRCKYHPLSRSQRQKTYSYQRFRRRREAVGCSKG